MKKIKNIVLEELIRLMEKDYKAPPEILHTLRDKLKMDPLIRYVDSLKAVNSIPSMSLPIPEVPVPALSNGSA